MRDLLECHAQFVFDSLQLRAHVGHRNPKHFRDRGVFMRVEVKQDQRFVEVTEIGYALHEQFNIGAGLERRGRNGDGRIVER